MDKTPDLDLKDDTGLVSVVVPVYNVERYLSECVDSLLNQTYQNIEIVLIDDGSTDGSARICSRYVTADARVRLYRKCNGGLSSARNYGLPKASGSWLMYVDSDDLLEPRAIELLMSAIKKTCAEVAVCDFSIFADRDGHDSLLESPSVFSLAPRDSLERLYSERSSGCAAWGKLARTELWERVVFPEGRKFEDFSRIHELILAAQSVCFVEAPLYLYRKRAGSITSSLSDEASKDLLTSIEELLDISVSFEDQLRRAALFKCSLEASRMCARLDSLDTKEAREAVSVLRVNIGEAIRAGKASLLQRARMTLIAVLPRFGSLVSRFFLR